MANMHMMFSTAVLVKVADVVEQEEIFGRHVQVAAPRLLQCILHLWYLLQLLEYMAVSHMTFFDAVGVAVKVYPLQVMC